VKKRDGFILLIGLILGMLILMILIGSYSGFISQYVARNPKISVPGGEQQQVVLSDTVLYKVKNNVSGSVYEGKLTIFPVDKFDYRLKLVKSDYETFAEIAVENVGLGVYQVVKLGEGDSKTIRNITLSVTGFKKTSCLPGEEC
jgi:hypothetical protein